MSAEKRITRKDMKQDKLVTTTFKATDYIQKHKQLFLIAVVAVVAVGIIAYYFSAYGTKKETESMVQLGKGDIALLGGDYNAAVTEYQMTIEKYGSTLNGRKAYILLGRAYYGLGDYKNAKKTYEEYLDKFDGKKPTLLYRAALVGLAASLRNLGDKALAADYYLKAAADNPSDDEKAYLLLDAARCLAEAKEYKKASDIFKQIKEEYKFSLYSSWADRELAGIPD